jgi:hypothetical protein
VLLRDFDGRRLVLGEAALDDRARQDADEASALDDGHTLEVELLQHPESLVERQRCVERVVRRLRDVAQGDRARIEPRGDDRAYERLATLSFEMRAGRSPEPSVAPV